MMNTDKDAHVGAQAASNLRPVMLTVQDAARILNCSVRTVYRLTDSGNMPPPVKLGALIRWPKAVIEQWIADGCPSERKAGQH